MKRKLLQTERVIFVNGMKPKTSGLQLKTIHRGRIISALPVWQVLFYLFKQNNTL